VCPFYFSRLFVLELQKIANIAHKHHDKWRETPSPPPSIVDPLKETVTNNVA
jgi:hypothetical protein